MTRYGFNFQWMLTTEGAGPRAPDDRALDFLAGHGFDYARIPMDYRAWTSDFDYLHPDEAVFGHLDAYLDACRSRGIHLCLNLHRAPGYCITNAEIERHDLWHDIEAQDGFVTIWETLTTRFADVDGDALSFDLVNEPPALGLRGFSRDTHETLIRRTVAAIRAIDPDRPISIDGLDGGNLAMPELTDLDLTHSTRAYAPYPVTHWGAEWFDGWKLGDAPRWPGVELEGRRWDRDDLRAFYDPWRAVEATGTPVHVGEFGCYEHTPNEDALRWFADVFALLREFGWGFALWELEGPFGIIGHRRPGARFERRGDYDVDVELLDLMLEAKG
ncbi:MAG: cellulase family glycosylhydrolase [Actinomycetota bacterium]|nr:cellulase family glycosylhydrolase [Actinomycetota bacterium]